MIKKILLVFIVILISFIVFVSINTFRTIEVDDSDLIYNPQKIADQENAYIALLPVLRQIKEEDPYDQVEAMVKDEEAIDYSKVSQLINQHSSFLLAISESLKLDSFQAPVEKDFSEPLIERYTNEICFLYKVEFLNIKKLLHEGDMEVASREILKLFKYGYLLQNSDGGLIYVLIGGMVKSRALDLTRDFVTRSNFDSDYYKKFLVNIEKYAGNNKGMVNSLRMEYTIVANTLKGLVEHSIKDDWEYKELLKRYKRNPRRMRYFYNENATIKELAEYFRQEIKNLNGPYADIEHKKVYRLPKKRFALYLNLLIGNPIGKVLLTISAAKFGHLVEGKFKIDARCNLAKLLLALRAYYADTNSLPNNLDQLVPNYISKIPKDPFDDKELEYSKFKKIIYSVGSDMKDDQGDREKDLRIELDFNQENI